MSEALIDQVDRITRRRARIATVMGILFIVTQATLVADDQVNRAVDVVRVIGWAVWAVMLLLFIIFGGGMRYGAPVRGLLNDESTQDNRRRALGFGFWAMMAGCALCYALSFYEPLPVRGAIHLVITIGVGAALLRFGALERRALRD